MNSESIYELYCRTKKLVNDFEQERTDDEPQEVLDMVKGWKESNEFIEEKYPQIISMYARRQAVINSFSREQIDHICYQIGDWYCMMKPLLEGQHNLGYMKEKLKTMICGD